MGAAASGLRFETHPTNPSVIEIPEAALQRSSSLVESKRIKVLLYGTGESGKSTLLRQLALIHNVRLQIGPEALRPQIIDNAIEGAIMVLKAMKRRNINFTNEQAQSYADILLDNDKDFLARGDTVLFRELDEEIAKMITYLYNDPVFKSFLNFRSDFHLLDEWDYFAQKLGSYPDWGGPEWMPDVQDFLRVRVRTMGLPEQVNFRINDKDFCVFDVGGQKTERNKQVRTFLGLDAVIQVVAISEYDQMLWEEPTASRLADSLVHWKETINNKIFKDTLFLLFFNKFDVFVKKYRQLQTPIDLNKIKFNLQELGLQGIPTPPKAGHEVNDQCKLAIKWFFDLFMSVVPFDKQKDVFVKETSALNQPLIKDISTKGLNVLLNELKKRKAI